MAENAWGSRECSTMQDSTWSFPTVTSCPLYHHGVTGCSQESWNPLCCRYFCSEDIDAWQERRRGHHSPQLGRLTVGGLLTKSCHHSWTLAPLPWMTTAGMLELDTDFGKVSKFCQHPFGFWSCSRTRSMTDAGKLDELCLSVWILISFIFFFFRIEFSFINTWWLVTKNTKENKQAMEYYFSEGKTDLILYI